MDGRTWDGDLLQTCVLVAKSACVFHLSGLDKSGGLHLQLGRVGKTVRIWQADSNCSTAAVFEMKITAAKTVRTQEERLDCILNKQ